MRNQRQYKINVDDLSDFQSTAMSHILCTCGESVYNSNMYIQTFEIILYLLGR
jgi:hypothetical protein